MNENISFRDPGEPPVLDWVDKGLIDIDPAYQRQLDEQRVQKILDWFSWSSFGAIVVAPTEGGRFHCTDGQHRLAAAIRHPAVSVVPAVIVPIEGTQAEAGNFVALNVERKNISPLDRHWAELLAGDPEALTVDQVCERAGVKLLRYPGSNGRYNENETVAVGSIRSAIDKFGAMRARKILEVIAHAGVAPITGNQIAAAALLLTDAEFAEAEPDALSEALSGANT